MSKIIFYVAPKITNDPPYEMLTLEEAKARLIWCQENLTSKVGTPLAIKYKIFQRVITDKEIYNALSHS